MRPSQRPAILEAALRVIAVDEGADITLDAVAREAGLTKPGLMYHFPTREALMLAIVDHAAARVEELMIEAMGKPLAQSDSIERTRAYVNITARGGFSRAEWAAFVQAAYRPDLAGPWLERMDPWFRLPNDADPALRARLTAARLAADGLWAADATGVFAPTDVDRQATIAVILALTEPLTEQPVSTNQKDL